MSKHKPGMGSCPIRLDLSCDPVDPNYESLSLRAVLEHGSPTSISPLRHKFLTVK